MKIIEITISPDGKTKIETRGFTGAMSGAPLASSEAVKPSRRVTSSGEWRSVGAAVCRR